MKKFAILLLIILTSACTSTPKEETETFEWNISDKKVILEGCEDLQQRETKADC